jgi:hypothetical protein
MKAGADRIHGDDIAARVSAIKIDRPNDEQLFSFQPFVFLRRHDCAYDASNDHARL